jgi:hypothetical protein
VVWSCRTFHSSCCAAIVASDGWARKMLAVPAISSSMSRLASGSVRCTVSISALSANCEVSIRKDSVAIAPCAAISATETAADPAGGAA